MVASAPRATSCLSYLIGPGPNGVGPVCRLLIGVANPGEGVEALRLRLSLLPVDDGAPPRARTEVGLLLPRRSGHELEATIDWEAGELVLAKASAPLDPRPARGRHLVRAELLDSQGRAREVLEVGVGSTTTTAQPRGQA